MDKVYENVYLSDLASASATDLLKRNTIKVMVSLGCQASCENSVACCLVFSDLLDSPEQPILDILFKTCCFIESIPKIENVLVHCVYGQSRSVSVVWWYLINVLYKLDYSKYYPNLADLMYDSYAVIYRARKNICVNPGFISQIQLCTYAVFGRYYYSEMVLVLQHGAEGRGVDPGPLIQQIGSLTPFPATATATAIPPVPSTTPSAVQFRSVYCGSCGQALHRIQTAASLGSTELRASDVMLVDFARDVEPEGHPQCLLPLNGKETSYISDYWRDYYSTLKQPALWQQGTDECLQPASVKTRKGTHKQSAGTVKPSLEACASSSMKHKRRGSCCVRDAWSQGTIHVFALLGVSPDTSVERRCSECGSPYGYVHKQALYVCNNYMLVDYCGIYCSKVNIR